MKTAITTIAITLFATGLFIEIGWLALVVLPVALLFIGATFVPLMSATSTVPEAHETAISGQTTVAFGD